MQIYYLILNVSNLLMHKILSALSVIFFLLLQHSLKAQDFHTTSGTSVSISANDVFHVNGLTLTPSSSFSLDGISITKNSSLNNVVGTSATAASRFYLFSGNTNAYSGAIKMDYEDGELNGLSESSLEVNIYNGSGWSNITSLTVDVNNNYVSSSSISGSSLREIGLASSTTPLPVTWLDFTATKQRKDVFLEWSTALEINTLDFVVQHSIDGQSFANLSVQPAALNSNKVETYEYLHTSPFWGPNYYRILQRDVDGEFSYSDIRYVHFLNENSMSDISINGNPITNNVLHLIVNQEQDVSLYNTVGQFYWKKHLSTGKHTINVQGLPKGTYFLHTNTTTQKFIK